MKLIISITLLITLSCKPIRVISEIEKKSELACTENEEFKKKFFLSIENVENYLLNKGKRDLYETSLGFISQYTHVSYEKTLNYDNTFPFPSFQEDKSNWLKWYEENKCNNIQIKTLKSTKKIRN